MPTTAWQPLSATEANRYEDEYRQQREPDPDFESQRTTSRRFELIEAVAMEYEHVWGDIDVAPPPTIVSEFCSRCPDHVHTVQGDLPDAMQDHVLELTYGDHRGACYRNAHITGVEILRREVHIVPTNPNLPDSEVVFENGQAHIILHFNREVRRVQWFIRDVDEYKNGVDWMTPFDTRWCTSRGGYYVGLQQAADLLMASLPGTSRDRTTAAPTLLVNHFTALLEAATKLRQPRFVTTPTGRTWAIALHDGEAAAPVRVEHAVLTRGIVTPADTSS